MAPKPKVAFAGLGGLVAAVVLSVVDPETSGLIDGVLVAAGAFISGYLKRG